MIERRSETKISHRSIAYMHNLIVRFHGKVHFSDVDDGEINY